MQDFLSIADGKMTPKNMNEYIFKHQAKQSPDKQKLRQSINLNNTLERSIQAKDNPPTITARRRQEGGYITQDGVGEDDNESEKTIDVAMDYIKRLERELKAKNNEHKFLKSRLDRALEKKAHPSVASW